MAEEVYGMRIMWMLIFIIHLTSCGGGGSSSGPNDDYSVSPTTMNFVGVFGAATVPPSQFALAKSLNQQVWLELDGGGYFTAVLNGNGTDTATIEIIPPYPETIGVGEYAATLRVHGYLNMFGSELAEGSPQTIQLNYKVLGLDTSLSGTQVAGQSNYFFGSYFYEMFSPVVLSIRDSENLSYGWQIVIDEYNVNGIPDSNEWLIFDKMSGDSLPATINITVDRAKLTEQAGNNFRFTVITDSGYTREFRGYIVCTIAEPCQ